MRRDPVEAAARGERNARVEARRLDEHAHAVLQLLAHVEELDAGLDDGAHVGAHLAVDLLRVCVACLRVFACCVNALLRLPVAAPLSFLRLWLPLRGRLLPQNNTHSTTHAHITRAPRPRAAGR